MSDAPYRPSNGTEGEMFLSHYCSRCRRDRGSRSDDGDDGCSIIVRTMALPIDHPDYPKEWVMSENRTPRCTAFDPEPPSQQRTGKEG